MLFFINDFPNPRTLSNFLTLLGDNQFRNDSYRQHKPNWRYAVSNKNLQQPSHASVPVPLGRFVSRSITLSKWCYPVIINIPLKPKYAL